MGFDFGEVFTVAARQIVHVARARGLSFTFDCQTAHFKLNGDLALAQGSFHRLMLALIDSVDEGSVAISALSKGTAQNSKIIVHAAAAGKLRPREAIGEAHQRLQLSAKPLKGHRGGVIAKGICPLLGGVVEMTTIPREGALLTLELDAESPDLQQVHVSGAIGARAWLINMGYKLAASWTVRLKRLGWTVSTYPSYEAASKQLGEATSTDSLTPTLVIVQETGDPATDGTLMLPSLIAKGTRFVYTVETGSDTLLHPESLLGYEVHVYPLSPGELDAMTRNEPKEAPAQAVPVNIPLVLIVDDVPINLVVGRALAEAAGYRVQTAVDGIDALQSCKRSPPDVVLMDMDMPKLGGIETIRLLRDLQRSGAIRPFPIVMLTARLNRRTRADSLSAGADRCLSKPLSLVAMAEELGRASGYLGASSKAIRPSHRS